MFKLIDVVQLFKEHWLLIVALPYFIGFIISYRHVRDEMRKDEGDNYDISNVFWVLFWAIICPITLLIIVKDKWHLKIPKWL